MVEKSVADFPAVTLRVRCLERHTGPPRLLKFVPAGYFDLTASQPPFPSTVWNPAPLKSIFSTFQMIWSKKKKNFFFWYKKIFGLVKFFKKVKKFFFLENVRKLPRRVRNVQKLPRRVRKRPETAPQG